MGAKKAYLSQEHTDALEDLCYLPALNWPNYEIHFNWLNNMQSGSGVPLQFNSSYTSCHSIYQQSDSEYRRSLKQGRIEELNLYRCRYKSNKMAESNGGNSGESNDGQSGTQSSTAAQSNGGERSNVSVWELSVVITMFSAFVVVTRISVYTVHFVLSLHITL
jgi:hypothetical protein